MEGRYCTLDVKEVIIIFEDPMVTQVKHPVRYSWVEEQPKELEKWWRSGCR